MISSDGEVLKSDEISSNVNTVSVVLPVVKTLEIPLTVDLSMAEASRKRTLRDM